MTAGHFGLAAGIKAWAPRLPLWVLMVSTYLLDIVFIVLFPLKIEWLSPADPKQPDVYGGSVIHAYYTHSLIGALLISSVAGVVAGKIRDRRGGIVIAALVFSHWILDLVVHRPDLPILPGNLGHLPLLGFGLWRFPWMSVALELTLILWGSRLYYRTASRLPIPVGSMIEVQRRRVLTASGLILGLLLTLLMTDYLGV
jgi:hypothetical protein